MLRRMRALLISCLLLAGCIDSEVGYYDFETITPLLATCAAGVDAARSAAWIAAVQDEPPDDFKIGTSGATVQAQFFRPDDSVLLTTVSHQGELRYSGATETANATIESADLGAHFSSLLEADSVGCEFDLRVATDFAFRADDFAEADGALSVEITETDLSDDRCAVVSCEVQYSFVATHSAGGDPGIWIPRE